MEKEEQTSTTIDTTYVTISHDDHRGNNNVDDASSAAVGGSTLNDDDDYSFDGDNFFNKKSDAEDDASAGLAKEMAQKLEIHDEDEDEDEDDEDPTIKTIAEWIREKSCSNIIVLSGAGVSCSAGIPDFRTPGTGLYDNLEKYNLPFPEAVFDLGFYRNNPSPFVNLANELWPGLKFSPTLTHSFITLLDRKNLLLRNYTQNIDMLEILSGVDEEKLVECHGHFRTASCIKCKSNYDGSECRRIILEEQKAPNCRRCGGLVKPDIVFFGEGLPDRFHRLLQKDLKKADLLIVMGTSLTVAPVSLIPTMVSPRCRRVLLNNELVGNFSVKKKGRDIFAEGDCDESVKKLCKMLGWGKELKELNKSTQIKEKKFEVAKIHMYMYTYVDRSTN
uniref:Deacetylase sirtuin-type domain-containing protein n=1 Tax=Ditylum brightwellii TaxID=49249 RepID=A0A7S2EHD3_9STRA|mmetsp:Transcript_30187/g.44903  ORF Transcript_30187/g.44903 Transcript_30187/m.44903 type:complete len:390 (+) Transcript_30187:352-1521(+)